MSSDKKILFIVNPASGKLLGKPDEKMVNRFFKNTEYKSQLVVTSHVGHASDLTLKAVAEGYSAVIAVGGDGTVNEIANTLNGTNCALGIIPCGSGNGLARHHKISLIPLKALDIIKKFHVVPHDSVKINNFYSFNVSGIGFDAHVAHLFGKDGKRGFNNYLKLVIKEFKNYQPGRIKITNGSNVIECDSMLTAIANGSQFGNNARISPSADTNDGLVDITVVKKMAGWKMPWFAYRVFTGAVASSPFSTVLQNASFTITSEEPMPLHIDGEPAGHTTEFVITSIKSSLKIIIP